MAELYNSPVPAANGSPPSAPGDPPAHLPGLSHLHAVTIVNLHLDQVDAGLTKLLGHSLNQMTAARDALTNDRGTFRARIFDLHTAVLTALTVDDFRLGKAYGLGRALAETALLPVASEQDRPTVFTEKFRLDRLGSIFRWLADLKTALPDHAAYAVSTTLHDWAVWVSNAKPAELDKSINPYLRRQGEQWRSLLSGERLAVDLLTSNDYVEAGKGLGPRLGHTIGAYISHYRKTVFTVILVILVVVGGIVRGDRRFGQQQMALGRVDRCSGRRRWLEGRQCHARQGNQIGRAAPLGVRTGRGHRQPGSFPPKWSIEDFVIDGRCRASCR